MRIVPRPHTTSPPLPLVTRGSLGNEKCSVLCRDVIPTDYPYAAPLFPLGYIRLKSFVPWSPSGASDCQAAFNSHYVPEILVS